MMLADSIRLDAFDRAFGAAILPGDVVVDIGAGLLILSLLAIRRGAAHVYAIEADPQTATIAREIVDRNDLRDKLTVIEADARTVTLPLRADVFISEMMGNLGPEEEMVEIIEAMADRNLRPGGRIVPQRLATNLQALEFDNEGWGVWRSDYRGYSFDSVQNHAPSTAQLHFFSRLPKLLSEPTVLADTRLGTADGQLINQRHQLKITRKGTLQALVGYFSATLAPSIMLSNFPSYPGCNWASWVWPVRHTAVVPSDVIDITIERPPRVRLATDWRLDCRLVRTEQTA